MKFAFVLCTIGLNESLDIFMKSLEENSYVDYEVIVIDQSKDDKVKNIINSYKNIINNVNLIQVDFTGLSKSRNYALNFISNDIDIIAFPDDDCSYQFGLLNKVRDKFYAFPDISIVTGMTVDKETMKPSIGRWLKNDANLNLKNIWNSANSNTIFIKKDCKPSIIFDELLGVGSKTEFGSGEETDLLIRLLMKGYKGKFFRDIVVFHPSSNNASINKIIIYAKGMGAVFRKNFTLNLYFITSFINFMIIRPLGGILIGAMRLKRGSIVCNLLIMINRWIGFLKYKIR
jgi:glycosyltransferase involved in cell wall biosynthesis